MGMKFEEGLNNLIELQKDYQQFHDDVWKDSESYGVIAESLRIGIDTMYKYQMMQADYETRLKSDMVAMLTEILLEAEENTVRWYVGRIDGKSDDVVLMETINDIIQQKINSLKAESEDKE